MNSQLDIVYGLLDNLEETLEKFYFGPFAIVRKDSVNDILDKVTAALPDAMREAMTVLRRKDELQYEAQQQAERIIADAQGEANRLLSESDILRAVQKEAEKIKEQVISDCEEIKRKAVEEADSLRIQAQEEAENIKKSEVIAVPEYGMEAVHKIEVKDMPAFIIYDNKGRSLY